MYQAASVGKLLYRGVSKYFGVSDVLQLPGARSLSEMLINQEFVKEKVEIDMRENARVHYVYQE